MGFAKEIYCGLVGDADVIDNVGHLAIAVNTLLS
jgi:hypothetical protein